ncbi:MAG: lytic transglycosylase domain-containing protein [Zoogloeaceae bacterium]|nr:lytic transglycosylase domain-containing protein [Rhodocyclaceae bacterium]MCP5234079.1 lytic transglycosylase domain-containing protein [Zoogloeaceae bacterium]MCP5241773.1 lytic transglycosylase domain-containing protein [Zoogloeaceae bacterium]MCP5256175.1 lytic transglycosylase domain-containing protein [Zoogloeaceae bacterium]MCW5616823.1 lytic transglycosylase domain-containing protein [Rhodocyclaceae bacterium]
MRIEAGAVAALLSLLLAASATAGEDSSAAYRLSPGVAQDSQLRLDPSWQLTPPAARNPLIESRPFADAIAVAAGDAGIEPALLHAVVRIESDYRLDAVSSAGAVGLGQLMPGTARRYGVERLDVAGPNLRAAARHLSFLSDRYKGELPLVLAAYNAGEGAVDRFGGIPPYPETQAYVPRVLAEYELLKAATRPATRPWQLQAERLAAFRAE